MTLLLCDASGAAEGEVQRLIVLHVVRSDWEVYGPDSPHSLDLTSAPHQRYKRRMGPTEVSYYLGSRGEGVESGVNDMRVARNDPIRGTGIEVRPAKVLR